MKTRGYLAAKLLLGVLPCAFGVLFSLFGATKMIEMQLLPSEPFGRPQLTLAHLAIFILLLCGVTGGVACMVAWLKEWRRNEERNGSLIAGLVVALIAIAGTATCLAFARTFAWIAVAIPPFVVTASLLRRECRLPRL